MAKKRIPVSKNITVRSDDKAEPVPVENVRPQPTVVSYHENPKQPTEHTTIQPGQTFEEAEARDRAAKEVHEDMKSRVLHDMRKDSNRHGFSNQPAGKPKSLPERILYGIVATLIWGILIGLLVAALAIIVWFIGWLVFGAW